MHSRWDAGLCDSGQHPEGALNPNSVSEHHLGSWLSFPELHSFPVDHRVNLQLIFNWKRQPPRDRGLWPLGKPLQLRILKRPLWCPFVWWQRGKLPWWLRWQRICLSCRRPRFDPWVRKTLWRMEWLPTPVFLPGEFHGQRSLGGYSPWGCKDSDTTE